MDRRTLVGVGFGALVLVAFGAALLVVGVPTGESAPDAPGLDRLWLSDTGRNVSSNHHVAVGGQIRGEGMVFAPISGVSHTHGDGGTGHAHGGNGTSHGCALVALAGESGEAVWSDRVPAENCTIHSVADPTLADLDADGNTELVAATTERVVTVYDPVYGRTEATYDLSAYGYTRPLVADLTGDGVPELVVVDARGNVFAVTPGEEVRWRRNLSGFAYAQPRVRDFDADGGPEVAVALGTGRLVLLDGDGAVAWDRRTHDDSGVTWQTAGDLDGDAAVELATATADGTVTVRNGVDGRVQWRRTLGAYAAVNALGDGDADGTPEVYATTRDGTLYALSGPGGVTEWTTTVADRERQMMPPPVLGDLDGDAAPELGVATNGGRVAVVDPASGRVLATAGREIPIWTHPTLGDVTGDGTPDLVVMYGDGRAAVYTYGSESESGSAS